MWSSYLLMCILKPMKMMINRVARILIFRRKFESITTRKKVLIYNVSELHLYEILKTATKLLRSGNSVSCLEVLIFEDEFLKNTNGRTRSRKICLLRNKYHNLSIRPKIRQVINCLLIYSQNIVNLLRY